MRLAVDIHRLLKGGTVEWENIDFRKSFHALAVLRSICAFANDISKAGGGYIVIGVELDEEHSPVFPVRGLSPGEITIFTREITRICKHIYPPYYPIVEVADYKNKKLLVLWVPVGGNRPYQIPQGLTKPIQSYSYVRRSWKARKATMNEELELVSMANQIPFDAQVHYFANITDLNINLIQEYLATIKSSLSMESEDIPFLDICQRMNIALDINNEIKPKNAGLLLFNHHPEKFFPTAYIEFTEFDEMGRFKEKIFTGPLFSQIEHVLTYLKGAVITKIGKAHSKDSQNEEYFNYPFDALKECVINAAYHRCYKEAAPIEIRNFADGIEIISYSGPLAPLDNQKLKLGEMGVRRYRNPILGHFLKQMKLVSGKAMGLEKIKHLMENNGNPAPTFETDKKRNYFRVFLQIHPKFTPKEPVLEKPSKPLRSFHEIVLSLSQGCPKMIDTKNATLVLLIAQEPITLEQLMFKLNKTNRTRFRNATIKPLMTLGLLEYVIAHKPKSGNQKYILTPKGLSFLSI